MNKRYDKIIIGAGIYGLYSALKCGIAGQSILVLECEKEPFSRATYVNQARVHMGYHYPRSLSTAMKSAHYYQKFHEDYGFALNTNFKQIYATSDAFSWTSAKAFRNFCKVAGIKCDEVSTSSFFNEKTCDGAFLTEEDTYDAFIIRDYYKDKLSNLQNVDVALGVSVEEIIKTSNMVCVKFKHNEEEYSIQTQFLLNATYASTNQILRRIKDVADVQKGNYEGYKIKYELCEIILCSVNEKLKNVGITVMDGPFFSIMPFGKTQYHSLTAVSFTPHSTCYSELPKFSCQDGKYCSKEHLGNCNKCNNRPDSAWGHMSRLAKRYLKPEFEFEYKESLFSMKPILKTSAIDDSRPTTIVINSNSPKIISVLSGKVNTVYDLDDYLEI